MKNYVKMTVVIFVAYLMTYFVSTFVQYQSEYDKTPLGDQISLQIQRSDGTMDYLKGNRFPILNDGDRLTAIIPIPEDIDYQEPILCFGCYNCTLRLSFRGHTLYTYGQDLAADGHHIGSVYASVPIPRQALGSNLVLRLESQEPHSTGELIDVSCMPGMEARHWIIMDQFPQALFLITVLTISFMTSIILLLADSRQKFVRLSLWLLCVMFLVAVYRLASSGILYSIIGEDRICSNAEYVVFFLLPLPMLAFCLDFTTARIPRLCVSVLLCLQLGLFILTTVLNYTTASYHYSSFIQAQHALILATMVSMTVISRRSDLYEKNSDSSKCMSNGLYNFFICVILDAIRYYLKKYTLIRSPLLEFDFLFIGIVLMSASFIMSIFLKVTRMYLERNKKDHYEHLAYTDIMTGMGNRTKYYETITRMRVEHTENFTIFFMDLNNLKEVNDRFGHEYGDLYIKAASQAIHLAFYQAADSFRIGGDEFLVLYHGQLPESISALSQKVKDAFERICGEQEFPFRGSIACGAAESTSESTLDIEQAVKMADANMYKDKENIKNQYGRHCRIVDSAKAQQIPGGSL